MKVIKIPDVVVLHWRKNQGGWVGEGGGGRAPLLCSTLYCYSADFLNFTTFDCESICE